MIDDLPPALAQVTAYRRATRVVVHDLALSNRNKHVALFELGCRARTEAELAEWCQRAVWIEARDFLEGRPPGPPAGGDPTERALRRLLHENRAECPTCRRPVPPETELDRWVALRIAAVEKVRRREAAC